ncbi:MAG TPA: DUF4340 domain-containing protein [Myxococcota bacterium]|nr:DUF4340 domain-containing protein [Myxococcota bacterium]
MKARTSLLVHFGALLVVALAAWIVFASPEVKRSKGKIVLDAKPTDLTRLELTASRKKVTMTPRKGGGFTLSVSEALRKPAAKGEEKSPRPPMITENKVTSYRASFELTRQLERLMPLYVERDLGKPGADKLEAFGLQDSDRILTIEIGGQKVSYRIGKQTFGNATNYVRRLPDGPVYLVSAAALRGIDIRAPRFLERRLLELKKKDCDAVDVVSPASGGQRKLQKHKLEHSDRWAPADEPDTTDSLFGTWVGKVFRLAADEYLDTDPQPAPPVLAKIRFIKEGRATDEVVLAGGQTKQGKQQYFARSAFSGQWVRLQTSGAKEVADDLINILKRD